jgi:DegV family protein with EDD domain
MTKVAIVTDSTTNLPKEIADHYGIQSAPANIIWSGEEFRDGIDISPDEFYVRLATADEIPTTSQATPAAFKAIFDDLLAQGYDIITATISSKLSGMYSSAIQARDMLPDAKIEVVDSLTGSMGLGWPIIKVAHLAKEGAPLKACKAHLEKALENVGILLMVDTLEFLHRGGRIGSAQRFLGTALNFKPILEVKDGVFEGLERVRTRVKALHRLVDLLIDRIGERRPIHLGVLHANAYELAVELSELVSQKVDLAQSIISEICPAVGVHLGPGAVGLTFMAGIE